jgi:hypothetical protein
VRAYLRLDPHMADKKADYPDGAHRAFTDMLCFAEQQPQRGRFRNRKLLAVLLERRAKWIPYLLEHGDLVETESGKLYVDGWDEWQEGDVTVSERMRRLRSRQRGVTPTDTPTVTPPVTVPTVSVPSSGGGSTGGKHSAEADRRTNGSPSFMGFRPPEPARPEQLTPERIASYRRHAAESRDPLIAANARETLERYGIAVEVEA